ncbi:Universal stress protein [Musa troglodytarum]|uniref:Universal stress protein n=2 Tax=Musa troglodytarum TaxID=320322 RepID=A0A9E7GN10_9LILI|nr:Universal stress protein [Musa troglodytarum]
MEGGGWNSSCSRSSRGSRRWGRRRCQKEREEATGWWGETGGGTVAKKRVMVVIDQSSRAKHAMMWALTHVANKGDRLALLHVVPHGGGAEADAPNLATLQALCRACKPEVEVEALVIQGPKLATVLSQCINKAECLTLAVRKQSKGVGGYLISTRWQKDFWLLA